MLEDALVPVDEQPYQIPENWCWTRIKHVSDVVTGSTPSKKHAEYYGGDFPFFKPADLEAGDNVVEATEYLSERRQKCIKKLFQSYQQQYAVLVQLEKLD